jgi:hypothetical protein
MMQNVRRTAAGRSHSEEHSVHIGPDQTLFPVGVEAPVVFGGVSTKHVVVNCERKDFANVSCLDCRSPSAVTVQMGMYDSFEDLNWEIK